MSSYYSSFIPGLSEPVQRALLDTLPQCTMTLVLDGLIAYETAAPPEAVRELPFVTNTFYVLKAFPRKEDRAVREMAHEVANDRALKIRDLPRSKRSKTFRVIPSLANQLQPLEGKIMQALEKRVTEETKLRPDRSKPDYEFWLLQRSEGYGFFSVRLSQHKAYDKLLEKGELRPELANVLCRLSEPSPDETFLDPFCGSGAIPVQRASFPAGAIIASDIRKEKIEALKQRLKKLSLAEKIVVRCDDALHMARYDSGSIHKIVTDPPWGLFEELKLPLPEFYEQMTEEFCRVLAPGGLLVVVTAQTEVFEGSIQRSESKLKTRHRYNILLSGKKASVYVLQRNSES